MDQIAKFQSSVHDDNCDFDVTVFLKNNQFEVKHQTDKLDDYYDSFEQFIDDLILYNPFWHTYYYVRVDEEYESIIKQKLKETIDRVFDDLQKMIVNTQNNWLFENHTMQNFANEYVMEKFESEPLIAILNSNEFEDDFDENETFQFDQFWNGFCPESALVGKRVKMRLNKNDFFESEATGLQMVIFSGVQAIILKNRGEGKFRRTVTYGHEIENGEILSPQTSNHFPFNSPATIFLDENEFRAFFENME